ncbi:unnamed protein product [Ranitomeya imitator]|uniref:Uncharacterized protein n=1 Tax=Ranitomeya imitator TaxID=111125 RepID=A0ABN9LLF8_9NEOB|nr:unnamed protein product [Ranitomeya imitator]
MRTTLNKWSLKVSPDLGQESPNTLECAMTLELETINPEEKDEMKVSVKLFILGNGLSSIRHAVDMACSTLAVNQLDSVILAPPALEDGREQECLAQDNKVVAKGRSDLNKGLSGQLYLWTQIKPSSKQVKLASCCISDF